MDSNNYKFIINLIDNNKLREEFINKSYNWIIDLKNNVSKYRNYNKSD